ncbi:MAG: hypothetical protein A2W05_03300 [Candidatus Schekmanbacteria bacterium RBG_16_38_10]|uniref:Xylose isomerase-like TIM barrel domain-containing protein n=1 Tax=Candidatus Schekmanbacteria bacterium RBG_16_38_10 TaxID=1817879 RepID=A0A1F7S1A1_9BACT|nr:MAG: hypothetical protein A2W05_03300 [Candidatus Schekmanbacteria bacterium RBG_16_38_10]
MKIGLKLYSTNVGLIPEALELKKRELLEYIELYVIPGSYETTIDKWRSLDIPYVIHAPHSYHGINFAQADKWETNSKNIYEAQRFADSLCSDIIIVHGGNNGKFDETLRQLGLLKEKRIVLENKPKTGILGEQCVGWSPLEFWSAIDSGIIHGTVLDFGHASCAAASMRVDVRGVIQGFMEFNPKIYHLADGDVLSEKDMHLNLGKGNFNLAEFIAVIPPDAYLTLETPRKPSSDLKDFVEDVHFLRRISIQEKVYGWMD